MISKILKSIRIMVKKKILITGVAGFLGSHLADKLKEMGHELSE